MGKIGRNMNQVVKKNGDDWLKCELGGKQNMGMIG